MSALIAISNQERVSVLTGDDGQGGHPTKFLENSLFYGVLGISWFWIGLIHSQEVGKITFINRANAPQRLTHDQRM
jgi:hypothetical protein